MARELSWSPEALEDVEQIAAYIERDSAWYAQAVVTRFFSAAESLREHSERGRIVPELRDTSVRECFVYSYRLIYRSVRETFLSSRLPMDIVCLSRYSRAWKTNDDVLAQVSCRPLN